MELILSNYGNVIATDNRSGEIYDIIKKGLTKGESIIIDAKDVTISTKAARIIFGRLYKELKEQFNEKISFRNNNDLFNFSVNEGISTELEN
ncbi:hypothetical protein [Flavobacterium sp. HTF]|uniref:hypothetical protein n=1 Tax=Flavobacterium sp. HTF TaxID=2170732 RepID=UPI000D5CB3DD|nr:hypothetical protein [Flavobacterium sp. HTF]PWB20682.1 hypothetical protein DCO46_20375 [Flavobacterium sp. HTF]